MRGGNEWVDHGCINHKRVPTLLGRFWGVRYYWYRALNRIIVVKSHLYCWAINVAPIPLRNPTTADSDGVEAWTDGGVSDVLEHGDLMKTYSFDILITQEYKSFRARFFTAQRFWGEGETRVSRDRLIAEFNLHRLILVLFSTFALIMQILSTPKSLLSSSSSVPLFHVQGPFCIY